MAYEEYVGCGMSGAYGSYGVWGFALMLILTIVLFCAVFWGMYYVINKK